MGEFISIRQRAQSGAQDQFEPKGWTRARQGQHSAQSWQQSQPSEIQSPVPAPTDDLSNAPPPEADPNAASALPPELEALLAKAYEQGLKEGRAQGSAEQGDINAEAAVDQALVDNTVHALQRAHSESLRQSAEHIAEIVVSLARRVIGDSLAMHPDALPTIIRQALARLPDDEEIWIDVRPEDAERLTKFIPESRRVHLVPDESASGGCTVRTRYASMETTLDAVMEGIEAAVSAWVAEQ